jgi:hypothetical protein
MGENHFNKSAMLPFAGVMLRNEVLTIHLGSPQGILKS